MNEPVLLKKIERKYELLVPKVKRRQGIIELKKGEEVVIACPGPNNYLKQTMEDTVSTSCLNGTSLAAGSTVVDTKNAECAQPVLADIIDKHITCAYGKYYGIGFRVCRSDNYLPDCGKHLKN